MIPSIALLITSLTLSLNLSAAEQPSLLDTMEVPQMEAFDDSSSDDEGPSRFPPPPNLSYTLPGIVGQSGAEWIGSDHLLNLTPNIHVNVDVIKPASLEIDFTSDELRGAVLETFEKRGFDSSFAQEEPGPPLPYFNILVMVQKIAGGYAATVQGRLFEAVTLKRVVLPDEITFQAITWEKENLLIVPKDKLKSEVLNTTDEIATIFLDRFEFFEKQKSRM